MYSLLMNAHTCVFSKVLVQFAGIVLIKDESKSDVAAPTREEKVAEQMSEEQENSIEGTKSMTVEEKAAEENGESPFIKADLFFIMMLTDVTCCWCLF